MTVKVFINCVEHPIKLWRFPTGEVGVKLINISDVRYTDCAIVEVMFSNNDDILYAINLVDALIQVGFRKHQIMLDIPYLPYSRQDRVCHEGESIACNVFLKLLETSEVCVRTFDLHSERYLPSFVVNVPQYVCAAGLPKFDLLIGPDKGSTNKVSDVAKFFDTKYIVLDKIRSETGIKITVPEGINNVEGSICIVDDLLDGGGTFIKAAEAIKEVNPTASLSLYVTHGFFTAGIDKLKEMYDTIYCKFLYNTDPAVKAFVKEI